MSDEARAKVAQLIEDAGIVFAVHYTGTTTRDDREMDAWRVTLSKAQTGTKRPVLHETAYYSGLGLRQHGRHATSPGKPTPPSAADVLYCLLTDADGVEGYTFREWAREYDLSDDSIKARDMYFACQDTGHMLRQVFDRATLGAIREALQDY